MDKSTKELLFKLALYGGAAYVLYLIYQRVSDKLNRIGADAGAAVYDATHTDYNPNGALWEVQFPNGDHHLIDSQLNKTSLFGTVTFIAPPLAGPQYAGKTMTLKEYAPGSYYAVL